MGRDDFLRERINDDMKQQQKECNKIATKVILTTNDFRMSVFIIPALTCGGRRSCCCSGCCYFPVFLFLFVVFSLSQEGSEKKSNKAFETSKECFYFVYFIFLSVEEYLPETISAVSKKPRRNNVFTAGELIAWQHCRNFVINLFYGFCQEIFFFGCCSRLIRP